jgi:hypothetical protein
MDADRMKTIESFRRVKTDMLQIQRQLLELGNQQEQMMQIILDTKGKEDVLYNKIKDLKSKNTVKVVEKVIRVPVNVAKKEFIASKTGKKFHIQECPFAKNIQPKSKVMFKSKTKALNSGYKACNCVKKI